MSSSYSLTDVDRKMVTKTHFNSRAPAGNLKYEDKNRGYTVIRCDELSHVNEVIRDEKHIKVIAIVSNSISNMKEFLNSAELGWKLIYANQNCMKFQLGDFKIPDDGTATIGFHCVVIGKDGKVAAYITKYGICNFGGMFDLKDVDILENFLREFGEESGIVLLREKMRLLPIMVYDVDWADVGTVGMPSDLPFMGVILYDGELPEKFEFQEGSRRYDGVMYDVREYESVKGLSTDTIKVIKANWSEIETFINKKE